MSPSPSPLKTVARHEALVAQSLTAGELIVSRGFRLLSRRFSGPFRELTSLPAHLWSSSGLRSTSPALAARMGVQGVLRLRSGALLVSVGGQLLRSSDGFEFERVLLFVGWRRPTWRGLLCDPLGRVFVARHGRDPERRRGVELYRSDDDGRTFAVVHRFAPAQVHHIHFVQADTWGGGLWMGTGDAPHEVRLLRSVDGGLRWDEVGGGDLRWRARAIAVLPDALIWGTDIGGQEAGQGDRLVRLDRRTGELREVTALDAPVESMSALPGEELVWTTVPPPHARRGGDTLTLWHGDARLRLREVARWGRVPAPRGALRASARLVRGQCEQRRLIIALQGCREMALGVLEADLPPR